MGKSVDMNGIMRATFGESSSSIRATFKKTVNVRQYETESYEVSSTLEVPKEITGIERMLLSAMLQAQIEYEVYIQMAVKGVITQSQLVTRKGELENDVNMIKNKGEELLGKPLDYLFELVNKENDSN